VDGRSKAFIRGRSHFSWGMMSPSQTLCLVFLLVVFVFVVCCHCLSMFYHVFLVVLVSGFSFWFSSCIIRVLCLINVFLGFTMCFI